jgi:hypothetical protein
MAVSTGQFSYFTLLGRISQPEAGYRLCFGLTIDLLSDLGVWQRCQSYCQSVDDEGTEGIQADPVLDSATAHSE